ncbi:MAG TPA: hypothetical protein VKE69_11745 [Planctomycetota bacterium]|nr:hypothetical protein [Planctomycetota bacterium]
MRTPHPFWATLSFLALGAVVVGFAAPSRASSAAPACQSGPASGSWDLPNSSSTSGLMLGKLVDGTTHLTAYSIKASLTSVPSPCLSCIQGKIQGGLSTPSGALVYFVQGEYHGSVFTGSGTFSAQIFDPTGPSTQPVGKISGTFSDPPGSTTPGTFKGNWEICP